MFCPSFCYLIITLDHIERNVADPMTLCHLFPIQSQTLRFLHRYQCTYTYKRNKNQGCSILKKKVEKIRVYMYKAVIWLISAGFYKLDTLKKREKVTVTKKSLFWNNVLVFFVKLKECALVWIIWLSLEAGWLPLADNIILNSLPFFWVNP